TVTVRVRDQDGDSDTSLGPEIVTAATPETAAAALSAALNTVSTGIVQSSEYYTNLVVGYYQQYLGRTPTAAEVAGWVSSLQHGATDQQVQVGFLSSPEFYLHAGGTDRAWIEALYSNLLGRSADAGGETAWLQALASGKGLAHVALGFATSAERESLIVQNDYRVYLGRTASAAEVAGWVSALRSGTTDEQVTAAFVGSQEYFQDHHANAGAWLSS